jgi:hypothetical protein
MDLRESGALACSDIMCIIGDGRTDADSGVANRVANRITAESVLPS